MRTVSVLLMAFLLAACARQPTPTAAPATTVASPTASALGTDTAVPGTEPPAVTATTPALPTPVIVPATLFVVQSAANEVSAVTLDGTTSPLAEAPTSVYALTNLSGDLNARQQVYALGPDGAQPLGFIENVSMGLAAWTDPATGETRLAWDTQAIDAAGRIDSRIFASDPAGADVRELLTELSTNRALHVVGWSADGRQLYFSYEPVGLGGYILFGGFSNLWEYDWTSGVSARLVPDEAAGMICLDDFTADAALVAHHCLEDQMSVLSLGQHTAIFAPAEVAGQVHLMGRGRFSPTGDRLAFSLAAGNPDNEQGWVAVSETLSGPARLVATAEPGDYFDVIDWVDDQTLLLQSWAGTPGLWLVNADGTGLRRLADGRWLATLAAR